MRKALLIITILLFPSLVWAGDNNNKATQANAAAAAKAQAAAIAGSKSQSGAVAALKGGNLSSSNSTTTTVKTERSAAGAYGRASHTADCIKGFGVGVQVPVVGVSISGPITDEDCMTRNNANFVAESLNNPVAAKIVACDIQQVRMALAKAGTPCLRDEAKPENKKPASKPATVSVASSGTKSSSNDIACMDDWKYKLGAVC